MTADEWATQTATLRTTAEALATEFADKAASENSNEGDRINAETARLIVETAGMKAALVRREDMEQQRASLAEWAQKMERMLAEEIAQLVLAGHPLDPPSPEIQALIEHKVALLDRENEKFHDWLAEHSFHAWSEAVNDLMTLKHTRSLSLVSPPTGRQ